MRKGQAMPEYLKEQQRIIKLGKKCTLKHECTCKSCGSVFKAAHKDKIYCSKNCMYKYAYHHGNRGLKQKRKNMTALLKKCEIIQNCELCEIHYSNIKTIKELGSTTSAAGSYFMKDHILPKSKGGGEEKSNIRNLCWFCNMTRKDMSILYDPAIKAAAKAFWKVINSLNN